MEAAARLLKLRGGRIKYLKLIKLLYFLDREALLRWGRPVTTDRYVSMDNGPVVSRIYELILDEPAPGTESVWRNHISAPLNWDVRLMREPETEELSPAEEALIDEVFASYGKLNRFRAGKKTEEEITATEAELDSLAAAESLLQPA